MFDIALRILLGIFVTASYAAIGAPAQTDADEAVLVFDLHSHTGPVRRLSVSPDGEWVVTASDDKTAIVWNLQTRQATHTLRVPIGQGDIGRLYGAAISPDGRSVALAGNTAIAGGINRIFVFDLATGGYRFAFDARGGSVRRLAWSPDGGFLAAVYVDRPALRVFRAYGELIHESPLPGDAYGLSIATDGRLAVTSFDGSVRLFRLGPNDVQLDGEIRVGLADPVCVSFSPSGRELAVGYYSRAAGGRVWVDVYDPRSRQRLRQFEFSDVAFGNLMNVAWQADGSALYAGGTGYGEAGRFLVKRIGWPGQGVETVVAAADSILDFAALPGGRVAFASFDAGWGILDGTSVASQSESRLDRVVAASALRISADASTLEWRARDGTTRSFALAERRAGTGKIDAKETPNPSTLSLRVSDWENARDPKVNGRALEVLPLEVSRASAVMPDGSSFVLGTSRALRRIDRSGVARWTLMLNTEVRAVNVSADGRLLVGALADGTLRWWRADDGVPLLSLLLLRDGRWVLWTEARYFDAGAGAEDIVGWLVSRPGGEQVDYFGASRLRDRYLRPDVIDQVLAQYDVGRAVRVADAERARQTAEQAETPMTIPEPAPLSIAKALPPVVTLAQIAPAETSSTEIAVDIKLFDRNEQAPDKIVARVDGRPVAARYQAGTVGANGESDGRMVVSLPKPEGKLQIFAQGKNGTSMPAELEFRSTAPALQKADRRPKLFVLSVGVSHYASAAYNLGLAAKDAQDFARTMEGQSSRLYRSVEARVLVDERATRAAVLQGLRWLQASASADDVAMLFLAGHGVTDAADTYYFLPHDMKETQVSRTGVSETQLRSTLSTIKGRALFFVDTCFSGKSVGKFTRREVNRLANGLASAELGVIVFSASAPRQESLEDAVWGNGAFTKALVAGLAGLADFRHEGVVTHKGLDYYVSDAVRSLTAGRQTPVTAVPNGVSDFPLAVVAASSPKATKE